MPSIGTCICYVIIQRIQLLNSVNDLNEFETVPVLSSAGTSLDQFVCGKPHFGSYIASYQELALKYSSPSKPVGFKENIYNGSNAESDMHLMLNRRL